MARRDYQIGCKEALDSEIMSESEMLAVDIIHDVPFSEEPTGAIEPYEWRFQCILKMAGLNDLKMEAKKRTQSNKEYLEIMGFILSERFRRLKSQVETRRARNSDPHNQKYFFGVYETTLDEFGRLIDSMNRLERNESHNTSDTYEESELLNIKANRLIRRLISLENSIVYAMANADLGQVGADLKERINNLHERMKKLGIKI